MSVFDLIDHIVHRGYRVPPSDLDSELLDALEWSDTDSGKDLLERADKIAAARAAPLAEP